MRAGAGGQHSWRILGASLYLRGNALEALRAWNRAGEPRVDTVIVSGANRTRQHGHRRSDRPRIAGPADAVGVSPRRTGARAICPWRRTPSSGSFRTTMRARPSKSMSARAPRIPSASARLGNIVGRGLFIHEVQNSLRGSDGKRRTDRLRVRLEEQSSARCRSPDRAGARAVARADGRRVGAQPSDVRAGRRVRRGYASSRTARACRSVWKTGRPGAFIGTWTDGTTGSRKATSSRLARGSTRGCSTITSRSSSTAPRGTRTEGAPVVPSDVRRAEVAAAHVCGARRFQRGGRSRRCQPADSADVLVGRRCGVEPPGAPSRPQTAD